jgi:hypothetical protein
MNEGSKIIIEYSKINLLRKMPMKLKTFSYESDAIIKPPLNDIEKVKSYSYRLKEVQNYIKKFKYPLADISHPNKRGDDWLIFWYPLELKMLNRTSALRVDLAADGTYTARRIFLKRIQ